LLCQVTIIPDSIDQCLPVSLESCRKETKLDGKEGITKAGGDGFDIHVARPYRNPDGPAADAACDVKRLKARHANGNTWGRAYIAEHPQNALAHAEPKGPK
jgi:hypothetical protein